MKKSLLIIAWIPLLLSGQWISTPTIIPSQPKATDSVQVIIETSTSSQGNKVYRSASVQKTGLISVQICNYSGMLPAIDYYLDTFQVGQLPAGAWTVQVSYSITSNAAACTPATQSLATFTFTVDQANGVNEEFMTLPRVIPNPADNYISLECPRLGLITLSDIYGRVLLQVQKQKAKVSLSTAGLPPGLYLLYDTSGHATRMIIDH